MNENKTKRLRLIRLINVISSEGSLTKTKKIRNVIFNLIFWWGVFSLLWCLYHWIVK